MHQSLKPSVRMTCSISSSLSLPRRLGKDGGCRGCIAQRLRSATGSCGLIVVALRKGSLTNNVLTVHHAAVALAVHVSDRSGEYQTARLRLETGSWIAIELQPGTIAKTSAPQFKSGHDLMCRNIAAL